MLHKRKWCRQDASDAIECCVFLQDPEPLKADSKALLGSRAGQLVGGRGETEGGGGRPSYNGLSA